MLVSEEQICGGQKFVGCACAPFLCPRYLVRGAHPTSSGWRGADMWRAALALVLIVGCAHAPVPVRPGTESPGQGHTAQQAASVASSPPRRFTKGEVLYLRQCADCHGWTGRGDGPLAAVLEKKPPNLRQSEAFTRYSEAELLAWILH